MDTKKNRIIDSEGRMPTSNAAKPKRTARKKFKRTPGNGMHKRRRRKIEW